MQEASVFLLSHRSQFFTDFLRVTELIRLPFSDSNQPLQVGVIDKAVRKCGGMLV